MGNKLIGFQLVSGETICKKRSKTDEHEEIVIIYGNM